MQIFKENGICIKGKNSLYIDCNGCSGRNIIISHAHSDHSKTKGSNTYFTTPETAMLIERNTGKNTKIKKLEQGRRYKIGEFAVSLHHSGHILGSSQIKVENDSTVVATSDFKLQKSLLFEPAEILQSDILIIESTFGMPHYSFPERENVYEQMLRWCSRHLSRGRLLVLGGYSTGKAQELTKFVNEFLNETPLVFPVVYEQNRIYEKHGVKLGDFIKLDNNLNDSQILIIPPRLINDDLLHAISAEVGKRAEAAIATGWNGFHRYKAFPLSDHADFNQLIKYIEDSEPKTVLTHHGFARQFARHVERKLKIPARELGSKGQSTLNEFS